MASFAVKRRVKTATDDRNIGANAAVRIKNGTTSQK
jgi:hypothetical protein